MKDTFSHDSLTRKKLARFIQSSKRMSMGDQCFEFEKRFSKWQKRKYATLFNSGASANLALVQSLKNVGILSTDDIIGFSALTWSTNVMPLMELNLSILPMDIEMKTLNISDYEKSECDSIFWTNALGFSPSQEVIDSISSSHDDIMLYEDNCESLGTEVNGIKTGNFGFASTFSFFVGHHLSTIEGGMICTDDENLWNMTRMVRANGWDRNISSEKRNELRLKHRVTSFKANYTFYDLAYNFRPTEITGYLGIQQMKYLDENIGLRERNYLYVEESINNNPDFIAIEHDHITRLSAFSIPILCRDEQTKMKYLKQFEIAGIETRPMIAGNITKQPFWEKANKPKCDELRETDFVDRNGFYCANRPDLTKKELNLIRTCLL